MASYNAASGPSRASRITLPPMMLMAPSTHQRPIDYNHNLSQAPYLRHSYMASADEHDYNYPFARSIDYHPSDAFPLDHDPSHTGENESGHRNTDASPSLSLSLLLAAANAAQADSNSIPFSPALSLGCRLDPSSTFSPAATSPEHPASWPHLLIPTSDSDRFASTSPQTPLDTPDGSFDSSIIACCTLHSDGPQPQEPKWPMDRFSSEPAYIHKTSLSVLSGIDYSNPSLITHHPHEPISTQASGDQKNSIILENFHSSDNSQMNTPPKSMVKRQKFSPEIGKKESQAKTEPQDGSVESSKAEKPKQGRKKRSVGYVRPIIIQRKRVGQRLLDMLKAAPIPTKPPSMELSRARCFPFADMQNKLKLWYGLQIEWPSDASFAVEELRSTRRMRLDELERLDKTLDGGGVKLRLSKEVLVEEPHRENEFSLPSDGCSVEEICPFVEGLFGQTKHELPEDQDELEETNYRRRKRRL